MRASLVKSAPKITPIGGFSPAVREMTEIVSALTGGNTQLARDSKVFEDGQFAPLKPVPISPTDRSGPGPGGMPEPRRWAYPIGYNLPSQPGATKLIDFQTLRNMADLHGVTRRCIEIRKSEIANADWEITVRSRNKKDALKALDDTETQKAIERITKFFERPDPIAGRSTGAWLKSVLEEVFVPDALSIYIHPTWDESALAALEVLDGTTIKPLIDLRGARPVPPNPAYQQFLYGYPRSEFQSVDEAQAIDAATLKSRGIITQFSTNQLLYKPYTERSFTPYGFSAVEQVILAINLALKREQWHLAYFTDSNVPAGLIHAPETWTPGQIEQYQEAFDALLAGDPRMQRRIKVVPGGDKFEQIKPPVHEMDFDHFLIRMVCLGLDVMPDEIGFPPESGLGGKGFGEAQAAIARRKSLIPTQRWLKTEILDHIISTQFGRPDLQWRWLNLEHDDAAEQEKIDLGQVSSARMTINGWRIDNDLEPFSDIPEAEEPLFITPTGPVFLRGAIERQQKQDDLAAQAAKTQMDVAKNPPKDPNKQPPRGKPSAAKIADLGRWKRKALKALKEGKSAAVAFSSEHIGAAESETIKAALADAKTTEAVGEVFKVSEAAPGKRATVIIARHPQTDFNAAGKEEDGKPERVRAWIDVPPNAQGQADARAMRDEICGKFDLDKVYSSDLKRACYLADLLAASCKQKPEESIAFRPWNLGNYAGKEITPDVVAAMRDGIKNPDQKIPGGESYQDFLDRTLPAISAALNFAQTDGKTVAIVAHTSNIRATLDWVAGDQGGTLTDAKTSLQKDDPVLPGGYIVLTNVSGKWKVDRKLSNEEDGAGDDTAKAAVDSDEQSTHPAWLQQLGAEAEEFHKQFAGEARDDGDA